MTHKVTLRNGMAAVVVLFGLGAIAQPPDLAEETTLRR